MEYGTLTSLWGPRFCSRRRGPRAAHEDLSAGQGGGALGTGRRGAVLQRPSIPVRSALRGESWHCLHGPGTNGVRAWRAWGSREELNRRTQLACFGFFGAPVAGKNPFFLMCFVTQGVRFKAIWFRRERGRFICWVLPDGKRSQEAKWWHLQGDASDKTASIIHRLWCAGTESRWKRLVGVNSTGCAEAPALHCPLNHVHQVIGNTLIALVALRKRKRRLKLAQKAL